MREFITKIQRLNYLISIRGTGNPEALAKRLGISERTLYTYIKIMKEQGAPIKFSNNRPSYYYEQDGVFNIAFLNQ